MERLKRLIRWRDTPNMWRILLVEDNKEDQRALVEVLGSVEEWEILTSSSTSQAEIILENQGIDLIVLDHFFHDKEVGEPWYRNYLRTHRHSRIRNIPVVFVSIAGTRYELRVLRSEKTKILMKPVMETDLKNVIRKLLRSN